LNCFNSEDNTCEASPACAAAVDEIGTAITSVADKATAAVNWVLSNPQKVSQTLNAATEVLGGYVDGPPPATKNEYIGTGLNLLVGALKQTVNYFTATPQDYENQMLQNWNNTNNAKPYLSVEVTDIIPENVSTTPSPSVTPTVPSNTLATPNLSTSTTDSTDSSESAANGGFLIYPNMPNTNMMQSVYSK